MFKYKRISIDYDGTLVEDVHPKTNGKILPGADTFTKELKKAGWEIYISTCRTNIDRVEIEQNLKNQGVEFDAICFYTKPIASLYIDDKGLRFNGNWEEMKQFIYLEEARTPIVEHRFLVNQETLTKYTNGEIK